MDKIESKGGDIMENKNVDEGLLRLPDVLKLYPVSRSTWLAGVKAKKFPARVILSKRCVAWRRSDIRRLIDGEAAQ